MSVSYTHLDVYKRQILHTADEEYPLYMKLDDIEQQIADEKSRFLRCHRSYIVNMDHITAVDEQFRFCLLYTSSRP